MKCLLQNRCNITDCTIKDQCEWCTYGGDRITNYIQNSNIPLHYVLEEPNYKFFRHCKYEDKQVANKTIDIIKSISPSNTINVALWGTVGSGKTLWATQMGWTYITRYKGEDEDIPVMFVNVPDFILRVKMSWKVSDYSLRDYIQTLKEVPMVIWDDLIFKGDYDDATYTVIYSILNDRTDKSNIFTTNYNPDEWGKIAGAQINSRLYTNDLQILNYSLNGDLRMHQKEIKEYK